MTDSRYTHLSLHEVRDVLLKKYGSDSAKISNVYSAILEKRGQGEKVKATLSLSFTQELVLRVAVIFKDLPLWFPTFLDFRGRIYRSGYPSIQGGGLSRSLLLWDFPENKIPESVSRLEAMELLKAIGFAVKKHNTLEDAIKCGRYHLENRILVNREMDDPLSYASLVNVDYNDYSFNLNYLNNICMIGSHKDGSSPYLYKDWFSRWHYCIPARKDASASVFQIMSILSNEDRLANYSNILSSVYSDPKINDLYTIIFNKFNVFMMENQSMVHDYIVSMSKTSESYNLLTLDGALKQVYELLRIENGPISGKLLKSIIMPYCYNVTVFKASRDVIHALIEKGYVFGKLPVGYLLTKLIFWFIELEFNKIVKFKSLLSGIGELAALFGLSLYWGIGSWTEVSQQYMAEKNERVSIAIKSGNTTKRSGFNYKKSLFICDALKAKTATPANQMHSMDAHIMYIMMHNILSKNVPCAGIHDCVVTTWPEIVSTSTMYYNTLFDVLRNPIGLVDELIQHTFTVLVPNDYIDMSGFYDIQGFLKYLCTDAGKQFLERKFLSKSSNKNLATLHSELASIDIEINLLEKQLKLSRGKNALHLKYLLETYEVKHKQVKAEIVKTKSSLKKVLECLTEVNSLYDSFRHENSNNTVLAFMPSCDDKFKQSCMY